ncbi:MAG: ATP-binding protein [Proteobacteria bacterium]|nr:ATP-binding protein [Pseudomonadota bacterium]
MTMSIQEIEKNLETLRLHGMRATLETRAIQANQGGSSFLEVFSCLLQDEIDSRRSRLIERKFKASGLDERKTLSEFDWGFNPKLPKKEIFELVTIKFIQDGEDSLLIGSPGTGKSHIAKTVAHAATQACHQVVYREAHTFFEDIFEANQIGRRKKVNKLFSEADLLIIDDLFLRKRVPEDAADDLLDIILNRYSKRKSTLITSNRPIEDWGKLLKDNAASSAILDRLLHRGHLLKFEGKSYRLKEAAEKLALGKKKE